MAAAAAAAVEKAAAADKAEAARPQAELGSQEGLVSQPSAGDGLSDGSGTVEQQQRGLDTASDGAVHPAHEQPHLQLPGSELHGEASAAPDLQAQAESRVTDLPQAPSLSAAATSTQQVPVQEGGALHAQGAGPQQRPAAAAATAPVLGQQRSGNPFADPPPAATLEARPSGNPFAGGSALDSPAGPSESSRAAWLANLAALAEVTQAVETQHQQQAHTHPGSGMAQPQADDLVGSQGPATLAPAAAAAGAHEPVPPAAALSPAKGNEQLLLGTQAGEAPERPAAAMLQAASVPYPAPKLAPAGAPRAASFALERRSVPPGVLHAPLHEEHRGAGAQHAGAADDHMQAVLQQAVRQRAPPAGAAVDPMQELQVERRQQQVQPGGQARHPPAPPDPMQALLEERQQQLLRQSGAADSPAAEDAAPDEVPAAELQAWVAAERQQREAEGLQAADEDMSEAEHVAVSRGADLGAVSGLHREAGPLWIFIL